MVGIWLNFLNYISFLFASMEQFCALKHHCHLSLELCVRVSIAIYHDYLCIHVGELLQIYISILRPTVMREREKITTIGNSGSSNNFHSQLDRKKVCHLIYFFRSNVFVFGEKLNFWVEYLKIIFTIMLVFSRRLKILLTKTCARLDIIYDEQSCSRKFNLWFTWTEKSVCCYVKKIITWGKIRQILLNLDFFLEY